MSDELTGLGTVAGAGASPNGSDAPVGAEILAMTGIRKRFGAVQALDGVNFEARAGEVHALLGENGAGKTTIMNVLAGIYQADSGEIRLQGEPVTISSPKDAVDRRVGMVHQHFELIQVFTALENIIVGRGGRFAMNAAGHHDKISQLAERHGLEVPLDRPVRDLAVGEQQKVAILRALYGGLDILILDEPTTHLTPAEVDKLFGAIRVLVSTGLTVILISHKMREVLAVADRITVLRRGRVVGTVDSAVIDERAVVTMLMGDATPQADVPAAPRTPGRAILELRSLRCEDGGQVLDLDLTVRVGELVGVAGVAGNGQGLLCDVVSGLRPTTSGAVIIGGRDVTRRSVAERISAGIALVPEDRLREGVLPGAPVYESYHLGLQNLPASGRWSRSRLREAARRVIEDYSVVAPNEDCPTANLSGGNIQKLLVARAIAITSRSDGGVMVAMNPTRGLDIGAAGFVHRQMSSLCEAGHAVVLVSEDLDELMKLCDRIVVLHGGSVVAEFGRANFDRHAIGARMVGASHG